MDCVINNLQEQNNGHDFLVQQVAFTYKELTFPYRISRSIDCNFNLPLSTFDEYSSNVFGRTLISLSGLFIRIFFPRSVVYNESSSISAELIVTGVQDNLYSRKKAVTSPNSDLSKKFSTNRYLI